jgi:protein TonB
LLASRNPCAIHEKDLRREQKRCKKCLVFSGVNVTMQFSCGGKGRQIRMDILDRDLFDPAPGTPKNTSWSMTVLKQLDAALGPGVMEKPMFSLGNSEPSVPPATALVPRIESGEFDSLFGAQAGVSEIAQAAAKGPPPPPTIEIESIGPAAPVSTVLPKYPPIARLAHVEGLVEATFDVGEDGLVTNIEFVSEPKVRLLQPAVSDALSKWKFPESAWGKSGKVSIRFKLNCNANPA